MTLKNAGRWLASLALLGATCYWLDYVRKSEEKTDAAVVSTKLRDELPPQSFPAQYRFSTYCVPYRGSDCKRT